MVYNIGMVYAGYNPKSNEKVGDYNDRNANMQQRP
jgi:hypothetical protein